MLLFPWLVTLLLLVLVAELLLVLPVTGRTFYREHRWSVQRPRLRLVAILTLIELLLVIAWIVAALIGWR